MKSIRVLWVALGMLLIACAYPISSAPPFIPSSSTYDVESPSFPAWGVAGIPAAAVPE
jgi:hypothetical protein